MKKISIKKFALCATLLLSSVATNAAYTVAVFESANPSNIRHFEFVSAGTNVSSQLIALVEAPAPLDQCSFWVGQDNAQIVGISQETPLSALMQGATCSGESFSFTIYAGGTDANYKPENFKCIDTAEYVYGMACWPEQLTDNCSGGANSAAGHIFTKNASNWTYTFKVNDPSSTFKLLKSADGTTWQWDAGQLGHGQSGTRLQAATGVTIAANGEGDVSLNLPGVKTGDYVTLTLQKNGAVYTLSAEYLATPLLVDTSVLCGTAWNVSCQITNYNAAYTYTASVNGGTAIPLSSNTFTVPSPSRGGSYAIVITALYGGNTASSDPLQIDVPVQVATPVLSAASGCGVDVLFTIDNYASYASTVVLQLPVGYVQNGDKITLNQAPVDGTNYQLTVTANDGCTTATSAVAMQEYKANPAEPAIAATVACDAITFDITNYVAANGYAWTVDNTPLTYSQKQYQITNSTDGVSHDAKVTVTAANGCTATATASAVYRKTPEKPVLTVTGGCDQDIVYTLTNYDASVQYTWTITTSAGTSNVVAPQNGTTSYKVVAPVDGITYGMQVEASRRLPDNSLCKAVSDKVEQQCQLSPKAPVVHSYHACQQVASPISWEDLVEVEAGNTLVWYDENGVMLLVPPGTFNPNEPGEKKRQVAQKSATGCIGAMSEVSVIVEKLPKAFAGNDMEICSGSVVTLASGFTPEAGVSYEWIPSSYLVNNAVANPQINPINVTLDSDITFTVTASNDNMPSCKSTDDVVVKVLALPQIAVQETTTGRIDVCAGSVATVTIQPEAGILYEWDDPDGVLTNKMTYSAITKALTADASIGVVATRVTSQTTCKSNTMPITFHAVELPVFSASGGKGDKLSVCEGKTIRLGETGNNLTTYVWESTPAGKLSSTDPQPTITVDADVTYTVTATLKQEPKCSSTSSVYVEKAALPTVYTLSAEGSSIYCEGDAGVVLMLSSSDTNVEYALYRGAVEYQTWQQGNGGIMRWSNIPAGVYSVKARVVSAIEAGRCQVDMNGVVEVVEKTKPTASLSLENTVACPGDQAVVKLTFSGEPTYYANLLINGVSKNIESQDGTYTFSYVPTDSTTIFVTEVVDKHCRNVYAPEDMPILVLDVVNMSNYKIQSSVPSGKVCPGEPIKLSINYDPAVDTDVTVKWSTGATNVPFITDIPSAQTTYTVEVYTEGQRCVFPESYTVDVATLSPIEFIGLDTLNQYCSSGPVDKISATPTGGSFSSDYAGFVDGQFLHPEVVVGQSANINLVYTITEEGCKHSDTTVVYVSYLPSEVVNWSVYPVAVEPDTEEAYKFCQPHPDDPKKALTLQGYPKTDRGEFSIVRAPQTPQEDPNAPDVDIVPIDKELSLWEIVNLSTGTFFVTYTIDDNSIGCKAFKEKTITIEDKEQKLIDNKGVYLVNSKGVRTDTLCMHDTEAKLYADLQAYGYYSLSVPEMVVSQDSSKSMATINPSVVKSVGEQKAVLKMIDEVGCEHRYNKPFYISAPVSIDPLNLKRIYCSYDEDVPIIITSDSETDGVVSIYRQNDDGTETLVDAVTPKNNPPYFRPKIWGAGKYRVEYSYTDINGVCDNIYNDTIEVEAPPVIKLNLLEDYCRGEEIQLKAEPFGGSYATSAPEGSIINNTFNTVNAKIGMHTIIYTASSEHGCKTSDSITIQVHGTDNLNIFGLSDRYCSPQGAISIGGFPTDNGEGFFTGPSFLTNVAGREGYADVDLTQGDFNTSYDVTYHYVETYTDQFGNDQTCESTLSKRFTILNEAVDFGGFDDNMVICGYETAWPIAANKTANVQYEFIPASAAAAFKDNGDGTAVIYPNLLPEDNIYAVKAHYAYIENGVEICTSEKTKSFTIANIAQVSDITLFCDNGENAVRLKNTEPNVEYELTVNGVPQSRIKGTGGDLDFPAIHVQHAQVQVAGYEAGCKVMMSKTLEIERLKAGLIDTDITCNGDNDGTVRAEVTGGRLPYQQTFVHQESGTVYSHSYIQNLPVGTYNYTVVDSVGCQRTASAQITEPLVLDAAMFFTDAKCFNGSTGSARVEPISGTGTAPYQYKWYNMIDLNTAISEDSEIADLGGGQYRCVITDDHDCTVSKDVTITAPEHPLRLSLVDKTDIDITGASTGKIEVLATGGTAPYEFMWTGNSFSNNTSLTPDAKQEHLLAGNYYITVIDAMGCSAQIAVTLTEPSPFVVADTIKHVSCNGGSDAFIRLTISGGEYPYALMQWTKPDGTVTTEKDLTGIPAGTYAFKLVDAKGNVFEDKYKVTEPLLLEVSADASTDLTVDCYGDETAHIDITVGGGTMPYTVTWPGLDEASQLSADRMTAMQLGKGLYTAHIEDANGCTATLSREVTQPAAPLSFAQMDVVANKCAGDNDGSIHVGVTGGTAPYSYAWVGSGVLDPTNPMQDNLVSGSYKVIVTDATAKCSIEHDFLLEEPAVLNVVAEGTDVTCFQANDATITANVTGGKAPYSYQWTHVESGDTYQVDMKQSLPAGTYNLEVTDALGCVRPSTITLKEPTALQITTQTTNVTCYDSKNGTAAVVATGGTPAYTYSWIDVATNTEIATASSLNHLDVGSYRVKVTDANGCFVWSDILEITQPDALTITYVKDDVAVKGQATGAIHVTVTGGTAQYDYHWMGPSITAAHQGQDVLTGLVAGNYLLEVKDAQGCLQTTPINIAQNEDINVTVTVTPVQCHGESTGSIEITQVEGGDGNYTYQWSSVNGYTSTAKNIASLPADEYTLLVTDGAGATHTSNYIITEPDAIQVAAIDIFSKYHVSCFGDKDASIRLSIEGGLAPYAVTWNGPDVLVQPADSSYAVNLGAGTYNVTVVDALGCVNQAFTQLIDGPTAAISIEGKVTDNACYGQTQGTIDITVNGGTAPFSYSWTGGLGLVADAEDQTTLHSGETYRVETKDANGCTESAVYTLQKRTPILFDISAENVKCHGETTGKVVATQPVGGTAPYVYKWENSTKTISVTQLELDNLAADKYAFTVIDSNLCVMSDTIEVVEPNPLTVTIDAPTVLCSGKEDGVAYANIPTGAGTPNYQYTWYKNDVEYAKGTAQIANLGEGNYKLVVVDANGCTDSDLATINSSTPMSIVVDVTHIDIHGATTGEINVTVSGGTQPLKYTWSGSGIQHGNEDKEDQTGLPAGWYNLIVEDYWTCRLDTTIYVNQPESMQVSSTVKNIKCYGEKGYIELRVQGGNLPYSAKWTGPNGFTSQEMNIYNLEPGTYEVNVSDKDDKNKVGPIVFHIEEKTPVEWTLLPSSKTILDCYGDEDGSLNIQVTGGTEPYSISWSGPNLDKTDVYNVYDLGIGRYKAEISDKNGCKPATDLLQDITQPNPIEFAASIQQNVCNGANTASIDITASGGTPSFTYVWTGIGVVDGVDDQSNLVAGNYRLVMQDANKCTIDTTFIIQDPVALTATLSGNGVICEGDEVSLHLNLTGVAPWTVEYTDGKNVYNETINDRFVEIKHQPTESCVFSLIKVVDAKGCEAIVSGEVQVEVHMVPDVTILGADKDCCLGEAAYVDVVFANEGGWNLTYMVDGQTIQDGTFTAAHDSLTITPLQEGTKTYTITRVSNAYCSKELNESLEITAYRYPTLSVVIDSHICEPTPLNVSLHATGGAPWEVVYYMNGLRYEHEMTTEEDVVTYTTYQDKNTFLFESITSGERCKTILGTEINNVVGLLPRDAKKIEGYSNVCRNSSVTYSTPAIEYAEDYVWELPDGYAIVSGLGSNQITVEVANDAKDGEISVYGVNQCGKGNKTSIQVAVDSPIATTGAITAPMYVCSNSKQFFLSIDQAVAGATHYKWSVPTGYTIVSGQDSRTIMVEINEYAQSGIVTVVPYNHCAEAQPIEQYVQIRPLPLAEAGVDFITQNCATDAQLNATPMAAAATANAWNKWSLVSGAGQIVELENPQTAVNDLLFGVNQFRWDVYDGYCLNYDTINVTNNNPGITQPEATNVTICEDFMTLRAPAPDFGEGSWSLVAGDGEVLTPNSNVTDVIDLSTKVLNQFRWEVSFAECSNSVIVDVVSHSLQALADAGEDGVSTNGIFRLSARNFNNSSIQGKWTVVAGAGEFEDATSPNTYVTGMAEGINTFRWTLTGYDCEAYDEVQVRSVDEPVAGFNMQNDKGCEPLTVLFDNITIGDAEYVWDFGDGKASTLRSPQHIFEDAGVYKVTLTAVGKRKTDKVEKYVTVLPSPTAAFTVSSTQLYVPNAEAHFFSESDRVESYYWDFGDGHSSVEKDPIHVYYEDGEYDINFIVTDINGCKDTLTYENYIHVGKGAFIVFPTAFTPNVSQQIDGTYSEEERRLDLFYPVARNVDIYHLEIFNQWGNMVFTTDDLYEGWNGYYLGQPAAQGSYVYRAEGRFKDGTAFREGGSILLIR